MLAYSLAYPRSRLFRLYYPLDLHVYLSLNGPFRCTFPRRPFSTVSYAHILACAPYLLSLFPIFPSRLSSPSIFFFFPLSLLVGRRIAEGNEMLSADDMEDSAHSKYSWKDSDRTFET